MRPDVIDLNQFYEDRAGQVARRLVRRCLRQIWPQVDGLSLMGLGYATPYLRPFVDEAERVFAVMPASQGVLHWPPDGTSLVALSDETELPFEDASIDRLLLVHGLENSEQVRPMLREIWRVLAAGDRLLAVVPNRRGIWARFDSTPFGHGHPFTPGQLTGLLRETMFSPTVVSAALYMPPSKSRAMLRFAPAVERLGQRWGRPFAGVLVVEAGKQIYAVSASRRKRLRPQVQPALPAAR